MISSNVFRSLAVAGALGVGALAAPAEAAVFQASATVSWVGFSPFVFNDFSLPKYSGSGTIVGVNIGLSGSAVAADRYPYLTDSGITVDPYSGTWDFNLLGPPSPRTPGSIASFLEVRVTAEYAGGSIPPCEPLPECGGPEYFYAFTDSTAFSGSVDVSDFSDFAGGGSNAFQLVAVVDTGLAGNFNGSATVTETILAVPEPSTWAMVLIGFAIVGFAAQSRRLARPLAARRFANEAV
jgi:PEP-CTERM motif-containing protein